MLSPPLNCADGGPVFRQHTIRLPRAAPPSSTILRTKVLENPEDIEIALARRFSPPGRREHR